MSYSKRALSKEGERGSSDFIMQIVSLGNENTYILLIASCPLIYFYSITEQSFFMHRCDF